MKMRNTQLWITGLIAAAALTFGAGRADASIIVSRDLTTPVPSGGGFTFIYNISLGALESLDTSKGLQFFTIYDFFGFTSVQSFTPSAPVIAAGGSFLFSTAGTGLTPSTQLPADDPFVPNLTYTYSGGVITHTAGPVIPLGTVTAESTVGIFNNDNFTGQATLSGALSGNIGTTQVPTTIPEPGSVFLLGSGLVGLASLARRRAARKTS